MQVNALFFASYRDLLGCSELTVDLGDDATVADFLRALRARGEPFSSLPEGVAVAVNRRYASHDTPLESGAEIALIPPVAGG